MDEFEIEQLRRNPKWGLVLDFYQRALTQSRNQIPNFDGWIFRVHEVPEVPADELSEIHGKLIAFGFLKFDLAGRDGGIRYQLTPSGKQETLGIFSTEEGEPESNHAEGRKLTSSV